MYSGCNVQLLRTLSLGGCAQPWTPTWSFKQRKGWDGHTKCRHTCLVCVCVTSRLWHISPPGEWTKREVTTSFPLVGQMKLGRRKSCTSLSLLLVFTRSAPRPAFVGKSKLFRHDVTTCNVATLQGVDSAAYQSSASSRSPVCCKAKRRQLNSVAMATSTGSNQKHATPVAPQVTNLGHFDWWIVPCHLLVSIMSNQWPHFLPGAPVERTPRASLLGPGRVQMKHNPLRLRYI